MPPWRRWSIIGRKPKHCPLRKELLLRAGGGLEEKVFTKKACPKEGFSGAVQNMYTRNRLYCLLFARRESQS